MNAEQPRVTVFGPNPLLAITIERRGVDEDDVHIHSAGQGVWVARMAGELGAHPILCGFVGGETGKLLRPLLEEMDSELRSAETQEASGCYVIDRRSGEREMVAHYWSAPPSRHETDDLFSITCAAALESEVLVVCGPVPQESLPLELYENLVANARANGTKVITDISSPRLDSALAGKPTLVKADEWQLAGYIEGPVTNADELRRAAEKVIEDGAEAVIATNGAEPALVLRGDQAWELVAPRFEGGAPDGCGDSMVGATAAALARGLDFERAVRIGGAAGATNFLRHGLGSGSRDVIADILERVELRPL